MACSEMYHVIEGRTVRKKPNESSTTRCWI